MAFKRRGKINKTVEETDAELGIDQKLAEKQKPSEQAIEFQKSKENTAAQNASGTTAIDFTSPSNVKMATEGATSPEAAKAQVSFLSNTMPTAGIKLVETISKDPDASYNQLKEASDAASTVASEEQKLNNQMAANAEAAIDAEGAKVASVAGSPYTRPTYSATASKETVDNDITKAYKNDLTYSPSAVMEKLGVQDYYPNIGKDIAVGTYSGSRLGSATIFAAPGTLIPMGLVDARKKALAVAAQQKQAAINKMLEFPDAPEQFDAEYKRYAINKMYDQLQKHNYNLTSFYRDRESVQELYRLQSLAKEMTNVDKIADQLYADAVGEDGGTGKTLLPDVAEFISQYRSAKINDFEGILDGSVSVSKYLDGLQGYANATKWADGMLSKWTTNPTQVPINLKTNKALTEANIGEIKDAIEKVRGGNGYDQWQKVFKKYFSLDVDPLVDSWYKENRPEGDPSLEWTKNYINAQIPEASLIEENWRQANDNTEMWLARFNRANELEDKRTYYTQMIETAKLSGLDGKISNAAQQIAADPRLTADQKQNLLASSLVNSGLGNIVKDKNDKNLVYGVTNISSNAKNPVKASGTNSQMLVTTNDGKQVWRDVSHVSKNKSQYKLTNDDKEFLNTVSAEGSYNVLDYEHRTYPGYYGSTDGLPRRIDVSNIGYASKQKQTLITEAYGNPVKTVYKEIEQADGTKKTVETTETYNVKVRTTGDISDKQTRVRYDNPVGKEYQSYAGGSESTSYTAGKEK